MADGPGFRTAIYCAGCKHGCKGCHNPQSWDFKAGKWMEVDELLEIIKADSMSNVTFSGGDPEQEAFDGIDELIVTDVYAASEDEIVGVNSQAFVNEFKEKSDIPCHHISGSIEEVAKELNKDIKPNDIIIGLGAGTITKLGPELLKLNDKAKI